jgi:hypothetical protein
LLKHGKKFFIMRILVICYENPMLSNGLELSNFITAVASQWLSCDHVFTPANTNATLLLQQRNGVFYAIGSDIL